MLNFSRRDHQYGLSVNRITKLISCIPERCYGTNLLGDADLDRKQFPMDTVLYGRLEDPSQHQPDSGNSKYENCNSGIQVKEVGGLCSQKKAEP